MSEVQLTIDGRSVVVDKDATILDAAKKLNINIPTLCYMDFENANCISKPASCRICVVEVEGRKNLAPACATKVTENMVVKTNTPRVLNARKTVLELMLSDHPADCLQCVKQGHCELQKLAQEFCIRKDEYGNLPKKSKFVIDKNASLVRDMNKCIRCRKCEVVCNKVQQVGALSAINRGFEAVVMPEFNKPISEVNCTMCGQCVAVCPTGALTEREYLQDVVHALQNKYKIVVASIAPAVRVALGEEFGMKNTRDITGKIVAALKRIGFDYVFDTDFAADVTIMEEGAEIIQRLQSKENLPIITSCCPAWINFIEENYPDNLNLPSSARSPQQIFGSIIKSYFVKKMGLESEDIVNVSIMPCIAKKYEANRPEFRGDVDTVITTKELARLIKMYNINFEKLEPEEFDSPMQKSTGAGVIFGTTGGVMEAALRTVYEKLTGKELEKLEFEAVRGLQGVKTATININGEDINIAVASGLGNAKLIMDEINNGNPRNLHAIEIMACPGGCIAGAGQPICGQDIKVIRTRQQGLYERDKESKLRKSHENPDVIAMYKEYFKEPMSHKAHDLLHTEYKPKHK